MESLSSLENLELEFWLKVANLKCITVFCFVSQKIKISVFPFFLFSVFLSNVFFLPIHVGNPFLGHLFIQWGQRGKLKAIRVPESNHPRFGFQAFQIWSSITIQIRFQQWIQVDNCDFDINLIYFRLKISFDVIWIF